MSEYRLPFPEEIEEKRVSSTGKYAHENFPESRHAIDYLLDVGTPILASRRGIVLKTESRFGEGGIDLEFANQVNHVTIDHKDGTYAEYLHLGQNQVTVKEGQEVETGDLLGYSGLSGCMSHPHLHFNVSKINDGKAVSIPFKFKNSKEKQ
jgi:murein DD-endopeptidase MepM/ murein hydrolase activator NlpD